MVAAAVTTWLIVVVTGIGLVARYDNAAGAAASAGDLWPRASRLTRDSSAPTLVMIVHPQCSCTRASLSELAEIMARTSHPVRAYVVFTRPHHLRGDSASSDLWGRATAIPGVTVVRDDDGREAGAFGSRTSGQVLVFDASGQLAFVGGTTRSRGHGGDNVGRRAILAVLNHEAPPQKLTPVYGCALFDAGDVRLDLVTGHDDHDH